MSVESDKNQSTSKVSEATIPVKLYDNLLAELRCPGCACPMNAPIKLCESGHAICHLCLKMLAKCPLCFKPFTDIRSLTLEAMSAKAQFKCSNTIGGCSVRLQLNLLDKHESQCAYQLGHCFMGKVWENCKWHGREVDWIDHCEVDHREKVFFGAEVTRTWELKRSPPKPICAFFLFRVFNETFNFYQIYDNLRNELYWTLVCASKNPNAAKRYSYELELFLPTDETKVAIQRNPCHSESDAGALQRSAVFGLGDIMKFMDNNRILHYRIKIIENDLTKRMPTIINAECDAKNRFFQTDYSQTQIEGTNIQRVPSDKIITRQTNKKIYLNGIAMETLEIGSSRTSRSTSNTAPSSKESSPKNFPAVVDAKKIAETFKSIKFGNRNYISSKTLYQSDRTGAIKHEIRPMMSNGHMTDSIDEAIIESHDLKKIFIRSYNIDVKNIEDFLNDSATLLPNSVPKPPRLSLDMEKQNPDEMRVLLGRRNSANGKSAQLKSVKF